MLSGSARFTNLSVAAECNAFVMVGALLYAAQLYVPQMGFLAFVSTTPWILLVGLIPGRTWVLGFSTLVYLVSLIIAAWLKDFSVGSWLIAPIPYMPFFIPLAMITRSVARRHPHAPLAVVWAILFTATEWLRITLSPGEISLGQLGYAVADCSYLIQIADIAGVSALTFLLAGSAGLLADILLWLRDRSRGIPWISISFVSSMLVFTITYGAIRLHQSTFSSGPVVAVIQPNAVSWLDVSGSKWTDVILEKLTRQAIRAGGADLVVWPENSVGRPYLDRRHGLLPPERERLSRLVMEIKAPLVVDGPSLTSEGQVFHTATLIRPDGTLALHDKIKLVPWSEYVPLARELSALSPSISERYVSLVRWADPALEIVESGSWDRMKPLTFRARNGVLWSVGVANCFEIASASFMTRWVHQKSTDGRYGINFIVSPANEVLLGGSVHLQTLRAAQLRAVEGRISVVRATDNGISALIDPNGRVTQVVADPTGRPAVNMAGFAHFRIVLDRRAATTYSAIGDALPELCLLLGIAIWLSPIGVGILIRERRVRRHLFVRPD